MAIRSDTLRLKHRRTKIVATLGPASSSVRMIERLIEHGVDVFRLNMSHGDHAFHRETFASIRNVAEKLGCHTMILADLSGPKIRCGTFENGHIDLVKGTVVTVTTRDVVGRDGLIPSQYEALASDVRPGNRILLDDGNLELEVLTVSGQDVSARVVHGGQLKDRKGMNLPGVAISAPSLTEKDRRDAAVALDLGADGIALSFVRRASDVRELRDLIEGSQKRPTVIAKIEKAEALDDIDAILDISDGIMVARGDLGVELPPENIPIIQSRLVELARARGRPVIVATQMLESMVSNARPTRAEVSDVSTAVISGADAVMLSAETASGEHPLGAVETMDRIARKTEGYLFRHGAFGGFRALFESEDQNLPEGAIPLGEAIGRATAHLSRDLAVRSIIVESSHGISAVRVSSGRPAAPVIAASPDAAVCRQMSLLWGVLPMLSTPENAADPDAAARQRVIDLGLGKPGEYILKVSGFHRTLEHSRPSVTVLAL